MRFLLYLVCLLLALTPAFSQQNIYQKDPTIALENFNFKAINFTELDSISRDYINAIEHSLYHRFDQAEALMKKVALHSESSWSGPARYYLLNELYFWRSKYSDYVRLADQVNAKDGNYSMAKALAMQSPVQVHFSADSMLIPVTIRKGGYIIATVYVNDRPIKLMLDTGAQFSIISNKLANNLKLNSIGNLAVTNSVNTTLQSSISILDSLSFGNVQLKNVPVIYTEKSKIFKRMHVDGLLGWDVLRTLCYTADFKAKTLTVRKPVATTNLEKNFFGIGKPLMVVRTSSGNQLNMYFDSGSNTIDLTTKGVAKLGAYSITKRPSMFSGIGKTKIGWFSYVQNFTFMTDNKSFSRKRTYLTPIDWLILNIKRDGILSNAPFQKGRLTIDYLNNHFDYSE